MEVADEEGRVRAVASTRLPEAGRYAPLRLAFPAQGPPGYQRFVVRLAAPSPEPELRDNERAVYVQVVERPVGPVLISLRPDWEPSFLIPNLDRLADAPTTGYLRLGDRLVGLESYRPVAVESVRRRARAAPLLVLHGYGPDAPDWARALAREARRLLVLPAGAGRFEVPGPNVRVGAPAAGEWYADAALPATPLALDLGGGALEGLPPLLGVRTIEAESAWSPLHLRRGRGGEPQPAVVVGQRGARRWAVAAAEGYWRWAFRSAAGRGLYRSLWTGVAGWLLADGPWAVAGLEPERRVVSRGELLRWVTPGAGAVDSLVVELSGEAAGEPVRLTAAAGDSLAVQLSPGRYRYVARAYRGGRLAAVAARGPVEVEAFTPELLPFAGALLAELEADEALRTGSSAGRRRRLATLGWPYLLLIALFCAEWAVRRVIGLR